MESIAITANADSPFITCLFIEKNSKQGEHRNHSRYETHHR